jgi:hypothetical protein
MSELSPKARALLEAARSKHGPSADDRERVLAGLHASLGIGAVLSDAGAASASSSGPQLVQPPPSPSLPPPPPELLAQTAASKAAGWSKLLAWKAGKIYLATLVIGGSAVGVSMVPRADESVVARKSAAIVAPPSQSEPGIAQPRTVIEERVVGERAVDERPLEQPALAVRAPEPVAVRAAPKTQARTRVRNERRHKRQERELLAQNNVPSASNVISASTAPSAAPEPQPLEKKDEPVAVALGVAGPPSPELSLIRAALTSLRDRDSLQALRLLDEHAARYPTGAFSTERRALRVVALCAAGRSEEGARERALFLKTAGDSPIAARVRSACTR